MQEHTATHLLDTNILSDLIRMPQGRVARKIRRQGEGTVCTSVIVAAEIRYGCAKKKSSRLTAQAEAILAAIPILPFEPPMDAVYGRIRHDLEASGQSIGPNDLLIAAHALNNRLILVTANDCEFSRVKDLAVENWLC